MGVKGDLWDYWGAPASDCRPHMLHLTFAVGPCLQEAQQLLTAFSVRNPLCLQHLNAHLPETMFQPEAGRPDRAAAQAALVRPGLLSAFFFFGAGARPALRLVALHQLLRHGNYATYLPHMCCFCFSVCLEQLQLEPLLIAVPLIAACSAGHGAAQVPQLVPCRPEQAHAHTLQAACQLTQAQQQDLAALRRAYLVCWGHLQQQQQLWETLRPLQDLSTASAGADQGGLPCTQQLALAQPCITAQDAVTVPAALCLLAHSSWPWANPSSLHMMQRQCLLPCDLHSLHAHFTQPAL